MKRVITLFLSILGLVLINAQNKDVPAFFEEMNKEKPNINRVDELYEQYRQDTSDKFSEEELKEIQKMKKQSKTTKRSSWASEAKKEFSPVKKEFRDEYEKEYIEWRKSVQSYIQADGSILYPTEEEFSKNFYTGGDKGGKSIKSRVIAPTAANLYGSATTPYHSTFNGWRYFGIIKLVTNTGDSNVTSQANVRAFAQSQSNPNVVVCSVESGTVYISHNKGKIWHLATKGYDIKNITALAISPTDENVIYAAGGHRHYVSRDGGVTWSYITLQTGYNPLSKYGESWRNDNPGGAASKIIVTSVDDNPLHDIVLFSTAKGILKLIQTDVGNGYVRYKFEKKLSVHTTDLIKRTNRNEYFALGYDEQKKHMYFYNSTDGGETWTKKGNGWFEPTAPMERSWGGRLAMSPNNENVVYAHLIESRESGDSGYLGVYRSDDGGNNWILPNPNGPGRGANGYGPNNFDIVTFPWARERGGYHQGFYNCAIVVDPNNPMHFIVGGLNAYTSTNGGESFQFFGGYSGPNQLHPDMQTFYQQKNADGSVDTWLTTDGGVNYSTDFFANMNEVRTAGLGSDYWGFDMGEYHTNMGGGMYHNGDNYHIEEYGDGVFKKLGGGESSTGYVFPSEDEKHMHFSDFGGIIAGETLTENRRGATRPDPNPNEPYAGGDNVYYTQRDFRGNTYYFVQPTERVNGRNSPLDIVRLYRFNSEDGKTSLVKEVKLPGKISVQQYAVSFSRPMYQYLVVGNRIFASIDGGENWEERTSPFANQITIVVSDNDPNVIYALRRYSRSGMLKKSTDGGRTYTEIQNPNDTTNYRHIVNVRGTDVIFLFGNNESRVYYLIDGTWKEYSEDLPRNLNVLEPKIQYRSGEFYMATSGAGIWKRELPEDVLAKMGAIKMNINSPVKVTFVKDYKFKVKDVSLYYGKTITNRTWEFPGAEQVLDANTDHPTVIYNKPGRFGVKLTLTDNKGKVYTQTFNNYLTVYPYCTCDVPNVIKNTLGDVAVWFDATNANLITGEVSDKVIDATYSIKTTAGETTIEEMNGNKVVSFKLSGNDNHIDLNKSYEGKTMFIVSKLNPQTASNFSFLFGDSNVADFHSGGRFGAIFHNGWISQRDRFRATGSKTMINNVQRDYFNTNFVTDNLALYTMRVGENQPAARIRYISKDRGQYNRSWKGEIAEVIIFNKRLTDAQITEINQYLMDKYNL